MDEDLTHVLRRFPKIRKELPPEYQTAYTDFYKAAREGRHLGAVISLKLERWMHRRALGEGEFPLLEIGAGTLNHVALEAEAGPYDIVEPLKFLYSGKPELSRIRNVYSDVSQVPNQLSYRRVISVAVLEHVTNLPEVLAYSSLLLEDQGTFIAGIPSEGALLWYLAWRFGTGTTFRLRYGLSYATFQRFEHVNDAKEIEAIVRLLFDRVELDRFPLPLFPLSLYTTLRASGPRRDVARRLLS